MIIIQALLLYFGMFLNAEGLCPEKCVCYDGLEVNCTNAGLEQFPPSGDIPGKTVVLNLERNNIKSLELNIERPENNYVTKVSLYENQIEDISENSVLSLFPKLRFLLLGNNKIQSISDQAFAKLMDLQELMLDYNQLKVIGSHWFNKLSSLLVLSLSHNNIETIDIYAFEELYQLKELYLHGNFLKEIRLDWFNIKTKLSKLSLGQNLFDVTSESFFRSFSFFTSLTRLSMSLLNIKQIESKWLKPLTSVQSLFLNGNKITDLVTKQFLMNPLLLCLDLHQNQIKEIKKDAFHGLHELKTLDLSDNRFSVINTDWLQPLSSLRKLYLHNNKIASWVPDLFTWPPSISEIWLQNNQFVTLVPLPNNDCSDDRNCERTVLLQNNNIFCGCTLHNNSFTSVPNNLHAFLCCEEKKAVCFGGRQKWNRKVSNKDTFPWPPTLDETWNRQSENESVDFGHFYSFYLAGPTCQKPSNPVLSIDNNEVICKSEGEPHPRVRFSVYTQLMPGDAGKQVTSYSCRASNFLGTVTQNGTFSSRAVISTKNGSKESLQSENAEKNMEVEIFMPLWMRVVLVTFSVTMLVFFILFNITYFLVHYMRI